jgi:hypothetical protein
VTILRGVLDSLCVRDLLTFQARHDELVADVLAHEVAFWDMALA